MANDRTGSVQEETDAKGSTYYRARIRLGDGSRKWLRVPEKAGYSKARASEWAAAIQEQEDASGLFLKAKLKKAGKAVVGELTSAWFDRYLDWKDSKGFSNIDGARGRWKKWLAPILGDKPIVDVTREDIEKVVRTLDDEANDDDGDIGWKSAINIFGDVTCAFAEAVNSKNPELRVLKINPTTGVRGPDRGIPKAKSPLYPDEFLKLVSCEAVPLERRVMYAIAVYTSARSSEQAAFVARDFDFAHQRFSVTKQIDRKTGLPKPTKTRRSRTPELEAELVPLVRALAEARKGERLLQMPPIEVRAELLRDDLKTAKVDRDDLFVEGDDARSRIVFHTLRDTGLTWMAVRGDDPLKIQWRGGHTDFETTQGYIAQAKHLAAGFGTPFPPLPASLYQAKEQARISTLEPFAATARRDAKRSSSPRSARSSQSLGLCAHRTKPRRPSGRGSSPA